MSTKMCLVSNLQRRPVVLRGNSGENIHFSAGEKARAVRALELDGNPMVEKLTRNRTIAVVAAPAPKPRTAAKKAAKKRSRAKTATKKRATAK